jgi:hypothetical protein
MEQRSVIRIVIASPGDVASERKVLHDLVDELNVTTAASLRLQLIPVQWETDVHPGFHVEGRQGLIDSLLKIDDCDIFIG